MSPSATLCCPLTDLNSDGPGNGLGPGDNQKCHQLTDSPEARQRLNQQFGGDLDQVLQQFQRELWAA